MRHLDLFSGIGGFALAASWVWGDEHEIVSFCEIEPYAQKVLKKHWPEVPCHDDIKTLRGDSFGAVDILTGGFPCQPFSVAGKQTGSADDRHLWPEMFRVIQEAKPTWIIGENVAGLVNMVEFEQCFLDLEAEGYETQAFIIPACGVDAKHRRDRIWIVANSRVCEGRNGKQGSVGGNGTRELDEAVRATKTVKVARPSKTQRTIPDNDNLRPVLGEKKRSGRENKKKSPDQFAKRLCSSDRGEGEIKPRVGRMVDGVSCWVDDDGLKKTIPTEKGLQNRLKGLGNAIVPQCVVPIMQAIKEIENANM